MFVQKSVYISLVIIFHSMIKILCSLKKFIPAYFVMALLWTGCKNNGNLLQLDHSNFVDEIATDQNLVFTFTSDLVPDSMLNEWDTTRYISFTPAVRGKFKWNAPNELTFSPSEPFPPSTDFEATLTDNLTNHLAQKTSLPKESNIRFHTPYLMLGATQVFN